MWAKQKGFTIVELLIVIVIISILSVISLTVYAGVQARARDSQRKDHLTEIKKGMILYEIDNGNFIEEGSGCGYAGDGNGWFNQSGGSYPISIVSCLSSNGKYLSKNIIDPTGGTSSNPTSGFAYMKYHCGYAGTFHVYIYAKLEGLPQNSTATDGTCNDSLDTLYGMNYYVQVR